MNFFHQWKKKNKKIWPKLKIAIIWRICQQNQLTSGTVSIRYVREGKSSKIFLDYELCKMTFFLQQSTFMMTRRFMSEFQCSFLVDVRIFYVWNVHFLIPWPKNISILSLRNPLILLPLHTLSIHDNFQIGDAGNNSSIKL